MREFPNLQSLEIEIVDCVIYDARVHNSHIVRDIIASSLNTQYLSPYIQQLNRIKEAFSLIKSRFRERHPRRKQDANESLSFISTDLKIYSFSPFYGNMKNYIKFCFLTKNLENI
ncbi:hypothetical protein RF11_09974 [Thelohanellus kitauei]|uniref:Uncharacterized protein n=1 Tax=Thelohanellus kitauei TaxID=669202 RepID=A0A0C2MTU8_THEKT|nr:hypothetical protein RF11_09974 [Thelohanellus kitauei]